MIQVPIGFHVFAAADSPRPCEWVVTVEAATATVDIEYLVVYLVRTWP